MGNPYVDWNGPYDNDGTDDIWELHESLLIAYLLRAAAGESVDMLLLELEANAIHQEDGP